MVFNCIWIRFLLLEKFDFNTIEIIFSKIQERVNLFWLARSLNTYYYDNEIKPNKAKYWI